MSSPIINQYNQIKKEHQDYLLFFRLGDFYELFWEDAKTASQILGITLTKRKQKEEDIPMAGVPFHTASYYISKLIKAGKKIAICDQVETAENKTEKIIKREVVRIITPGTVDDDVLLENKRNNFLIALHENNIEFKAAIFDLSTNEFFTETGLIHELKDFLEKIDPKEILIFQKFLNNLPNYDEYRNLITIANEINNFQAEKIILEFFNLHSKESIEDQSSLICIAMILEYLKFTQKKALSNIALPKSINLSHTLKIDKFTKHNLEILRTLRNDHKGSLIWLLDDTQTPQGGRLLFKIINNPINDIQQLKQRHDEINYFIKNSDKFEITLKILKHTPDFERLLTKILLNKFNSANLIQIGQGIKNLYELANQLQKKIPDLTLLNAKLIDSLNDNPEEKNLIKKNIDAELDDLKKFESEIENQIQELENAYKIEVKIANLRIKFLTNIGFVIEINSSLKEKMPYHFVLIQELKNAARYMTATLDNINKKFTKIDDEIKEKENEILNNLANEVLTFKNEILEYAKTSSEIDLYSNFAKLAMKEFYVQPELTHDKSFEITEGRHPILDKIFNQEGKTFVKNDCILNPCTILITGANMAGKSTYLRQQALIVFLSHIGMFVPATSAKIGIVDHLFSRIGTNDNLIEGNSTFMMEMIEIGLTLNQASEKSFIIFDEVGRGTSQEEGMALAQAILEYLCLNLKARTLFATHYLSLTDIENANLQKKTMQIITSNDFSSIVEFTYKIIQGVATKSFALSVAKLAGIPDEIIKRAQNLINNY